MLQARRARFDFGVSISVAVKTSQSSGFGRPSYLSATLHVPTLHHPGPFDPPAAFLLSKPYVIAMSCGLVEFLAELRLAPVVKRRLADRLSLVGLVLLLLGEALRKTAMVG